MWIDLGLLRRLEAVRKNALMGPRGVGQALLQASTSLTPAMLIIATVGMAKPAWSQDYIPFGVPPNLIAEGSNGQNGADQDGRGQDGGIGATPGVISRELLRAASTSSVFSTGGQGGAGGRGLGTFVGADGGAGGNGGAGGTINVRLNSGSSLNSSAPDPLLRLFSTGGAGGMGGNISNSTLRGALGDAGNGGSGGSGGLITFVQQAGASILASQQGVSAVALSANGGNETGTYTSRQATSQADGGSGGRGGDGGSVASASTGFGGLIRSAGSGVIATANGGNGADGGAATASKTLAVGGDGGAGGNGGIIDLIESGSSSSIAAVGAAAPATGNSVTKDGVSLRLSSSVAGIMASSRGGLGGAGGEAYESVRAEGGNGGAAGNGGAVTLRQDGGSIGTTGYAAAGLIALSGGGTGGDGSSAEAIFFADGGSGGAAGTGAAAAIRTQRGSVTTSGDGSPDLLAQSLGGGGGFGGDVTTSGPVTVAIGGRGGDGGEGGGISVFNGLADDKGAGAPGSVLTTAGADSPAIIAESIGGGGGIGGDAAAFTIGLASVAIGGSGAGGGNGGSVVVGNLGVVQTKGAHSPGIFAQSVGGGGGDAGFGSSVAIGAQFTASTAIGGDGGTGGVGSIVNASNGLQIATNGFDSAGMLAQSVGGGGGEGGDAISRVFQVYNDPKIPSILVNVALGGRGGAGSIGGQVTARNSGAIVTTGSDAFGILSQSVGGGGGDGGDAQTVNLSFRDANVESSVSIGGHGGSGGNAGSVTTMNTGLVFTLGEEADAVFAQSAGGGGGNGAEGNADTGSLPVVGANPLSAKVTLALGGSAGTGGSGGTVVAGNAGSVLTRGDSASGLLAQSVGGGGGTGGLGKALGSGGKITVNVGLGGSGGNGGNGGTASATNAGTILTTGGDAPAVIAQSVGGGGGIGGEAASGGGTDPVLAGTQFLANGLGVDAGVTDIGKGVYLLSLGAYNGFKQLSTLKTVAAQYLKQNIGGAPPPKAGNASVALNVQVGVAIAGGGGSGGAGGPAEVINTGAIETDGPDSPALQAQSIGGGGGDGGASNPSVGTTGVFNPSTINAILGVGGAGGSSGNGGTATVSDSGSIDTEGDLSFGIEAESIGGGGGNGGETVASNAFLGKLTIALGGHGGASGAGGNVLVSVGNGSTVVTSGRDATAVFAQSAGGGGGLADIMGSSPTGEAGNGRSRTGLFFTEIPIVS